MSHMMPSVPGVERRVSIEADGTQLGMLQGPLELLTREPAQERDPAPVERFQERERGGQVGDGSVGKLRPPRLVVGLDRGPVLRDGQLEADIGVHVAVRNMVDNLGHGPAAIPIGGEKPGLREALDGPTESRGRFRNLADESLAKLRGVGRRRKEWTDGIARVAHPAIMPGPRPSMPRLAMIDEEKLVRIEAQSRCFRDEVRPDLVCQFRRPRQYP